MSCRANDICKESKRQTINGEDVLKAIEEIDFPELIGPLRASLDGLLSKLCVYFWVSKFMQILLMIFENCLKCDNVLGFLT